jgi:hypothetical protein
VFNEGVAVKRAEVSVRVGLGFLGAVGQKIRQDSFVTTLGDVIHRDVGRLALTLYDGARATSCGHVLGASTCSFHLGGCWGNADLDFIAYLERFGRTAFIEPGGCFQFHELIMGLSQLAENAGRYCHGLGKLKRKLKQFVFVDWWIFEEEASHGVAGGSPVVDLEWRDGSNAIVDGRVVGKRYPRRKRRPAGVMVVGQDAQTPIPKPPEDLNRPIATGIVAQRGSGGYVSGRS